MERKSYDPRITDVNDPRYTALNAFGSRVDMTMLLTDDAYFMGGFVLYDLVDRMEEVRVSAGDQVVVGQRFGMVSEVYKDGNVLLGIRVQEHLPYVPLAWKNNVEGYYGEGGTIRGREAVYLFRDPDGEDVGEDDWLTNLQSGGLPIESIYRGTLKVLHKQTADIDTWNDIMKSVERYQSDGIYSPVVQFPDDVVETSRSLVGNTLVLNLDAGERLASTSPVLVFPIMVKSGNLREGFTNSSPVITGGGTFVLSPVNATKAKLKNATYTKPMGATLGAQSGKVVMNIVTDKGNFVLEINVAFMVIAAE